MRGNQIAVFPLFIFHSPNTLPFERASLNGRAAVGFRNTLAVGILKSKTWEITILNRVAISVA